MSNGDDTNYNRTLLQAVFMGIDAYSSGVLKKYTTVHSYHDFKSFINNNQSIFQVIYYLNILKFNYSLLII